MSGLGAILRFLLAMPVSLLPERWRERMDLDDGAITVGTILTGVAQLALVATLWWVKFEAYRHAAYEATSADVSLAAHGSYAASFVYGGTLWIGFLFSAWGLIGFALLLEATLRLGSGMIQRPLGLALFGLVDVALQLREERRARPRLGEHVPDLVTAEGDDRVITTWRPRDWDALTTLRVDGELYRMVEKGERERRWIYRLRPIPPDHLVRSIVDYQPDPGPPSPTKRK